jgi:hypothetical protein
MSCNLVQEHYIGAPFFHLFHRLPRLRFPDLRNTGVIETAASQRAEMLGSARRQGRINCTDVLST